MNQEESSTTQNTTEAGKVLASITYPLCKQGLILLLVVGLISVGLQILLRVTRFLPIGGMLYGILNAMLIGSILGYVLHVITKTADGEDTPPDWQDISNWNDILRPIFLLIGTVIISFGPAIGWVICVKNGYINPSPIFWILLVWGCFYFPMALTSVAMMDTFAALHPVLILVSIFRTGWVYLYASITLIATVGLFWLISNWLPKEQFLTGTIILVLLMYLLMVMARICGLIYRLRREKLNWLCE